MAHDQEVMGSNPGTVYWMDVRNLIAITLKRKIENKDSQMGHTKKILKKDVIGLNCVILKECFQCEILQKNE
jgi:hypothetical protein